MIYLHSSSSAAAGNMETAGGPAGGLAGGPSIERDDSISVVDDASSVASGVTTGSASTKSVSRTKKKVGASVYILRL